MSTNQDVTRRFTAAQNARDIEAMEACLTEDCHFESARLPIVADGRQAVAQAMATWLDAHTDYSLTTVREFYVGDEGYNEWRFKATNAAGERIETHGVDYYRFKDGLIEEKNSFRKFLF
jgi:ketosteroid isomerase-like protein